MIFSYVAPIDQNDNPARISVTCNSSVDGSDIRKDFSIIYDDEAFNELDTTKVTITKHLTLTEGKTTGKLVCRINFTEANLS